MPNHTYNCLKVNGENYEEVLKYIAGENTPIDFNKIIPMPESLNMTSGSVTDEAIVCYCTNRNTMPLEKCTPLAKEIMEGLAWDVLRIINRLEEKSAEELEELFRLGSEYVTNYILYGFTDWYGWCNHYWGTKWNAYDAYGGLEDGQDYIEFYTAWSDVGDTIIRTLSTMFPKNELEYTYSYEGEYWIKHHDIYSDGVAVDHYDTVDYDEINSIEDDEIREAILAELNN